MTLEIERDDIIHYLDLVDSIFSPNFIPKIGRRKPYWKLFKKGNQNTTDYKRFLDVYNSAKEILNEREIFVLDSIYGVSGEFFTDVAVSKVLNISSSRVSQIRRKAESKIGRRLYKLYIEMNEK